jgi:hypothetical protein
LAAWIAIVVLICLLVAAIVGVALSDADDLAAGVSMVGNVAMVYGALFTIGLMAPIFYSRRDCDEPTSVNHEGLDREP